MPSTVLLGETSRINELTACLIRQDGKPYILQFVFLPPGPHRRHSRHPLAAKLTIIIHSVHAAPILPDARANGYTILARARFASFEDMMYFDRDCPAHLEFKKTVKEFVRERPLMAVVKEEVTKEVALELI
jgi:hypothetical protein